MKINYFKVIPEFIKAIIPLIPIFIKYGKIIYEECKNAYDKEYLLKLDETIKESLMMEE